MPGLKSEAPAARKRTDSCGRSDIGRVARDGVGEKTMALAPTEFSIPDPRLVLRKRLHEEMEALRGLVKKAKILASNKAGKNGVAPRCGKEGRRFLEAEDRPEATEDQKTARAKKRKTTPPAEIVELRTPKREIVNLASCVSSLSANMPTMHVEEVAPNAPGPISRPSPCQQEEGEIVEEDDDVFVDICGGASPNKPAEVDRSSPLLREDAKMEEENVSVDICSEASPVAVDKFAEAENSPSGSNSSGCSDSSDSDSCSSSGYSCCDSSGSGSSGSDSDAESVASSPAPAVLVAKSDASPVAAAHKVLCSSPCLPEEGEILEEECGGASPVAAEFAGTSNSPRSGSSLSGSADNESVGSSPVPSVSRTGEESEKPVEPQIAAQEQNLHQATVPALEVSDLVAKAREKMWKLHREPARQKAYDELEAMKRNALPSEWIHPMHMVEFGITAVEYVVTSDRPLPPGRGGPVQRLFGLLWKGE